MDQEYYDDYSQNDPSEIYGSGSEGESDKEEEEEEEEDGEESALTAVVRDVQAGPTEGFSDLYLDTVNR